MRTKAERNWGAHLLTDGAPALPLLGACNTNFLKPSLNSFIEVFVDIPLM